MKRLILFLLLLPSLAWGSDLGQDYARMNAYILGASAAGATFCSSTTQTTNGTTVRVCEDLKSDQACWSGATGTDAVCRWTWTVTLGTPTVVTTWDSASSFFTDANSSAPETLVLDSGAVSTTLGIFAYVYIDTLPLSARNLISVADTSVRGGVNIDENGKIIVNAGGNGSTSTNAMSAGSAYYMWMYYDDSSGASDGVIWACFSSTTTRPADPTTDTANCSYFGTHNVTNDVDSVRLTNGSSASKQCEAHFKNILVSTSAIGDNP